MGHAELSPSASKRWMNCPGSVRLSRGIPDRESDAAAEGTFAHAVAADLLETVAPAAYVIGERSPCQRFRIDGEFAEHLQTYLDAVRLTQMIYGGEMRIEREVKAVPEVWGTADALLFAPGRLDVFDLKFGAGVFVPVKDNPQARIYACGALVDWPKVDTVGIHIVQPRHFSSAEPWRTEQISAAELRTWRREVLQPAVVATKAPDAPLKPGDWCTFCPAKTSCPARRDEAIAAARHVFQEPAPTPVDPRALGSVDLLKLLPLFDRAEAWMSEVRAVLHERAEQGETLPGYKLVAKIGNRAWRDADAAEKALRAAGIEPKPAPKPPAPKLLSPAQAEKALGKGGKKVVDPLTTRPQTGSMLVPSDDPRPLLNKGDVFNLSKP